MRIALASITALALAAPAFATPVEDFRDLIADYEAFTAERNLGARARAGDLEAAASWPDSSLSAIEDWDEGMAGFDARIDAIDPADLPADFFRAATATLRGGMRLILIQESR